MAKKKSEPVQYYTTEQIHEALDIIESHIDEIMSQIGTKANFIGWLLNPRSQRPCDAYPEADQYPFGRAITNDFRWCVPRLEYDGNLGHDILWLAEKIKNGEI